MMAKRTRGKWSYLSGEKGRNRVRAFEHTSGVLMVEFKDSGGKRKRESLGHRDRERAKQDADNAAAKLGHVEISKATADKSRDLTLQELFDIYGREVTPRKGERSRKYDQAATKMFAAYWGPCRVVMTLSLRDWERFIQDRRAGRIGPGAGPWRPVNDRSIESDVRLLTAVFNWATMAGDGRGGVLLPRNPFKGYKAPKEKNPRRVSLSNGEYAALLGIAERVDWRFYVALVLAHETGHRIGAIRQLLWSDIDLEQKQIRWRAETEKTGYAHVTPMTPQAEAAVRYARERSPGIGDAAILPAPKDLGQPVSRHLMRDWWSRAEGLAELAPKRGRGWHSLRRKFASDLKEVPLKTLCALGGWKTHVTVLMCYQQVDEAELRSALGKRRMG